MTDEKIFMISPTRMPEHLGNLRLRNGNREVSLSLRPAGIPPWQKAAKLDKGDILCIDCESDVTHSVLKDDSLTIRNLRKVLDWLEFKR